MVPEIDLVLVFRSSSGKVLSKPQARENTRQAEQQYTRLLDVLKKGGLRAVGKRGEREGQLLVLVSCRKSTLGRLVQRERYSDFLCGLPSANLSEARDLDSTGCRPLTISLDKIKDQFGEAVALYFAFLSFYTNFLLFISAVGVFFYFFALPYASVYSSILLLWSVTFVEWWRIKQRILSVQWGTRGSFRVEKRRAQYTNLSWWRKDLRMIASLPVILLFAAILAVVLTGIFIFEAFVTQLYTGPGHRFISFSPTILFFLSVPHLLSIYHTYAVKFTNWENHAHQSTHDASLTIKTFSLSAIVAYLGLALSAFVYVPGQRPLETNGINARSKLSATRLQDQMFAFTVTNQVVNTFLEIGLPFVLRAVESVRSGRGLTFAGPSVGTSGAGNGNGNSKKKRVMFEDQASEGSAAEHANHEEEREFMERRDGHPFGYVALWSTIWPLAPVMSLLNNWLELRSDAFKIAVHTRRPMPMRTDTIGPWLESLTFLTWLAALTNSALVYLFRPQDHCKPLRTSLQHDHRHLSGPEAPARQMLGSALLIALAASHGYIILRVLVRHTLERCLWRGSAEEREAERVETVVKEQYLKSLGVADVVNVEAREKAAAAVGEVDQEESSLFWAHDEGLDELTRTKDA
ncbi:hypothetical protein A0H81_13200 [Grifola frondosa]|uniref:DUF590-domain-containing protein n=1 Tax=Grifola frondosa TaxID=5627 RepID=A0A1C7LQ17_GRIFR|nr:hypothetical protein A0H81_13200 [Grifola frondosa]